MRASRPFVTILFACACLLVSCGGDDSAPGNGTPTGSGGSAGSGGSVGNAGSAGKAANSGGAMNPDASEIHDLDAGGKDDVATILDSANPTDVSVGSDAGGSADAKVTVDATFPDVTTNVNDSPTGQAFNPASGMLNVEYAQYLSKHDITYSKPNTNPLYGLTVGNGRMGAMVWSANGLTMQVSGVDVSEQGAFSAGLVNLATTPALDAGTTAFQQVLSLYDGTLTTTYGADRTVTIMGSPNSEVMGIHVEDARPGVSNISLDLSLWDVAALGNSGDVPNINTWQTVTTYADETGAGISRGQADPNNFGYTLAASVEGATFTTQTVGTGKVRLSLTPTTSYTIWLSAATRLNAPNHDSIAAAKSFLASTKGTGYTSTLAGNKAFWHTFWSKSFAQYSNASADADYLESVYYLSTYLIASGGFGNYPFHFINGVYRATQDNTKWSNAYWYWNQRDVYNSFLASNHADLLGVFNNMYSRNSAALKAYTMTRYNVAGIWVPETMGWDGNARGTVGSDYTKNIYSTGTEAAENMYSQYAYTGDAAYLSNTVYPFMKEVANFYVGMLTFSGTTYNMTTSNSHETYWNVPNAITDLAAVRSLFPILIQTSQKLGLDATLRAKWQDVLDKLAPYPTDATDYLPHAPPIAMTRNNENVASELIWPYSVTGIGAADYARALSTWNHRPFPYGNVWANDAIQAARLGLGDETYQGMKTMLGKYQNYPNGFTNNTNGVFEYLGVHLSALNESLLQSYNDKIRVFPAIPGDSTFVGRFTMAAKGGFWVSSEREGGEIKYVGIKSLNGNQATVVNPWGTEAVQVRREPDGAIVSTSSSAELTFATAANGVYVVERTAKPLSRYTYARITGTANRGVKKLSNPVCTLGM